MVEVEQYFSIKIGLLEEIMAGILYDIQVLIHTRHPHPPLLPTITCSDDFSLSKLVITLPFPTLLLLPCPMQIVRISSISYLGRNTNQTEQINTIGTTLDRGGLPWFKSLVRL